MTDLEKSREIREDEIDLRDYINVIIRRWRVIAAVFLIGVITAGIVIFRMPKVYQSSVSILISSSGAKISRLLSFSPLDVKNGSGQDLHAGFWPAMSINTHKTLLKSSAVLERVIGSLNLTDSSGRPLTLLSLSGKLEVKKVKETDILELIAKDNLAQTARELADAWALEYIKYSREFILGEVKGSGDFVAEQFKLARQNFIQAVEKINKFKEKNKIDLMRQELHIKKTKINANKKELLDSTVDLKTEEDLLKELKKEIARQDKFIIVSKAITDEALWQKVEKKELLDQQDKIKLRSEEINPLYQELELRVVDAGIEVNTLRPKIEYIKESIDLLKKEIDSLEKTVNQSGFELAQRELQVETCKRTHDNLSIKVEETRLARAMELGDVKIISQALEPEFPIKPRKRQLIAVSGIISLMLGIFIAFFMEYLQPPKRIA